MICGCEFTLSGSKQSFHSAGQETIRLKQPHQAALGTDMKYVKTDVSIPEDIYRDAEQAARDLGMTRSRLYAEAVADFLNGYRNTGIKAKLNEAHGAGSARVDPVLAAMQFASLPPEEW
jgi:hypothetical protein